MTHDDINNVTPTMTHDDVNNSLSHFEEKIFQTIIRLSKEVNHKRRDIDSIFDFINKSTASNITNESLEEIITDLVNKNLVINKKSNDRDSFRHNTTIANSTITDTHHEDTAYPNTVKSNIENYLEGNVNTPSNISQKLSPEFTIDISPSNETSVPPNIHASLVTSVPNDNSSLTQKNIFKTEAQLLALKSYKDCELCALTLKIDVFSDSIKIVLSDSRIKKTKTVKLKFLR